MLYCTRIDMSGKMKSNEQGHRASEPDIQRGEPERGIHVLLLHRTLVGPESAQKRYRDEGERYRQQGQTNPEEGIVCADLYYKTASLLSFSIIRSGMFSSSISSIFI
jgi:hypothetical protein